MDERAIKAVVDEQAEDDGLWFIAETCAEAYLQQQLRRLHEVIEGKTSEQCEVAVMMSNNLSQKSTFSGVSGANLFSKIPIA
jgi:hypothetical protein